MSGRVFDNVPRAGVLVCADLDQDGRCGAKEPQSRTDSAGNYRVQAPKGVETALVAHVERVAGTASEVPSAYRMASPASQYSADITPFTTLVQLTGERDFGLAEDLARNVVGLPPKFPLRAESPPAAGTLAGAVTSAVVSALIAADHSLDLASSAGMVQLAAVFPDSLTALPQLRIVTKDGAPIVSKEDYVDAQFTLSNPVVSADPVALNGKIRGRGHSTWGQPKNPYKVQFKDDAQWASIADVLGMPKNRNWALLADYFDRSLIRNKLALSLGSSTVFANGLKWTPSGQHLEVWLNGDYIGVYLLTEDIRIDTARLNIRKMNKDPAVGELDGGYIVEVDARLDCYKGEDVNLQHVTPWGVPICVDTPDEEAITAGQLAYIKNLLDATERDLYTSSRSARINPVSFVDWYLLSELFRNHDSQFYSSVFMWKDTAGASAVADRLLNIGPLWDFDRAAGNINYNEGWMTTGCWVNQPGTTNWYVKLFEDPEFVRLAIARWKAKRPALARFINASIDTYAWRLDAAQRRNFERWPILGAPLTNYYTFLTYDDEVAFVRRFLNERMAWMDAAFESPESFMALCK